MDDVILLRQRFDGVGLCPVDAMPMVALRGVYLTARHLGQCHDNASERNYQKYFSYEHLHKNIRYAAVLSDFGAIVPEALLNQA
ncbi:hypothetical protein HZD82_15510 [Pantoea agglomerans]|nr:hypothetical protein [Pantoea agglomerans]MBN9930018.1 hypothetical protein [Pantoea agglomerans]